jgi:hypothetical protein
MTKKDKTKRDPMPESFDSLEEAAEFWDTHSIADYEDVTEEVHFNVKLQHGSYHYYPVSKDLVAQLRATARSQGISTETLINLWLQEKLAQTKTIAGYHTIAESAE